ncbi:MAG: LamG domain-containing protein [Patescibacteria group bacterium]
MDYINTASSGYYYAYVASGTHAVVALLESEKYLKQVAIKDGGTDDGRAEFGNPAIWASASGIRGLWRLDGNANDSSGFANNGTVNGPLFILGKLGSAASFSFGSQNITIPDASSLFHSSTTSILAWVKRGGIMPIYSDDNNSAPQIQAHLKFTGVSAVQFRTNNGGVSANQQFVAAFPVNAWGHVAFTWIGGKVNLHIDGSFIEQKDLISIPTDYSWPHYIGSDAAGAASQNGILDELCVYNRDLSAPEIQAIYKATR